MTGNPHSTQHGPNGNRRIPLATEALLVDHVDGLRCHLRARLPNHEDADDLAQEVCLRMLQAKRSHEIRHPSAYLYRIAHNLLYKYYTVRRVSTDDGVAPDDLPSPGLPLDEAACLHHRCRMLDKAMHELSQKCQIVVHLRWREGLTVDEIACRVRLSRGMVKKYLAGSIAHFRKRLGRFADVREEKRPDTVPIDPPNSHY